MFTGYTEQAKYEEVWKSQDYRDACNARADTQVDRIAAHFKNVGANRLIDLGCGTGRLAKRLIEKGFDVEGVDIARNAVEEEIHVTISSLWKPIVGALGTFDGVICLDVLEHLPEQYIKSTLWNIERLAPHGYLLIALGEERMKFDEPLHLTMHTVEWWQDQIHFCKVNKTLYGNKAVARY